MKFRKAVSLFAISALVFSAAPMVALAEEAVQEEIQDEETIVDDETVVNDYNPGPSTNRQTSEAIEKISSSRSANGTKRTPVKEVSASSGSSSGSSNSSRNSSSSSGNSSSGGSSYSGSSSYSEQSTPSTTQSTPKATPSIGQVSEAPQTSDSPTLYLVAIALMLGIAELLMVKRLN